MARKSVLSVRNVGQRTFKFQTQCPGHLLPLLRVREGKYQMFRYDPVSRFLNEGPMRRYLRRPQENERSPRLSSHNIVAVDPDSSTVAPYPMSRPPDVIAPAHIITRAAIIIGPITNLDRDSAGVRPIASVTGAMTRPITCPIKRSV